MNDLLTSKRDVGLLHGIAHGVSEVLVVVESDLVHPVGRHVAAVELTRLAELRGHLFEDYRVVLADHLELEVAPPRAHHCGAVAVVHKELTSTSAVAKEVVEDVQVQGEANQVVAACEVVEAVLDLSAVEAVEGSDGALVDDQHLLPVVLGVHLGVKADLAL